MADYRKQFADAILAQQGKVDPIQQKYEQQLQMPQGASLAPTMALVDSIAGTRLSAAVPQEESTKDRLGQLLKLRQAKDTQGLEGLGQLAKMQGDDEARSSERQFKERMYGMQMMNARAKLAKAGAPKALSSEDKNKLGFANEVTAGIQKLRAKIEEGGSLSPDFWANNVSDNEVNAIRRAITENYGRMQSGGAISGDEEKRFGSLVGDFTDGKDLTLKKLMALEQEMANKRSLYGGAPMERSPSASMGSDYDSMDDAELAAMYAARKG